MFGQLARIRISEKNPKIWYTLLVTPFDEFLVPTLVEIIRPGGPL